MRLVSIAIISSLIAVAACGGGGGNDFDAPPRIDTRPPVDAPIVATCAFSPTYNTLSLGGDGETPVGDPPMIRQPVAMMPGAGVGQTPTTLNYYLAIFGDLAVLEPTLPNHGFELLLTDNIGAFAAGGPIGPWGGPPTVPATSPTIDQLLGTGDPNEGFCGECTLGYGGMPNADPPSQQNPATQVYLADSGTMTITRFSAPPVDGQQSQVFGTFDNLVMTGYDPNTGNPLDPPCTTSITRLSFFYNVTWGVPAVAPQAKHAVKVVDVQR